MKQLHIDIETFSKVDLTKSGVYRYAEESEILLFGYSVDDGPVIVADLTQGEKIPEEIIHALADPSILKSSFNASYERILLSSWLRNNGYSHLVGYGKSDESTRNYLSPDGWICTMVWCSYLSLPMSLEKAGEVLGLESQKMKEGKDLIRYFCTPCKPTKTNGGRVRNMPSDSPAKWSIFKAYNRRDVEVEIALQKRLSGYPVPESEWENYRLDQTINDRGIGIDMPMVTSAIRIAEDTSSKLIEDMRLLTGVENPNSVQQLKTWLGEQGMQVSSLGKKELAALIKEAPEEIRSVLELRSSLAKSSIKKYQAMKAACCSDGRAHGTFQFYGAGRTGRWAGRLIQLQNLPQNHLENLDGARSLVASSNASGLAMLQENIPDTLSQLIRTALIPRPGYIFFVADFSAIEARVIAWMAGEEWRQKVFAEGRDIYCASASAMFHVPVEKNGINGHLRTSGKVAELALGYGGGVGALKAMGALDKGLKEEDLQPLVDAWRNANPNIRQYWWDIDKAAKEAIIHHSIVELGSLVFEWRSNVLFITLPSGRQLTYIKPRIGTNEFGTDSITYEGLNQARKWDRLETYGPKLAENITQAVARDILCCAMQNLSDYAICAHVHDEVIIEAPEDTSLEEICTLMGKAPSWADGLLLRADGYTTPYYRKD